MGNSSSSKLPQYAESHKFPSAKIPEQLLRSTPAGQQNSLATWEFNNYEVESLLYGYFTLQDNRIRTGIAEVNPSVHCISLDNMPSPKSSKDFVFSKFSCGRIFEPDSTTSFPNFLPEGFRLISVAMGTGNHYAVISCQKAVVKGTRFGPYTGIHVKPGDLYEGQDNAQMWEVYKDGKLSHYIDGTTDTNNWMKFVNCARQSTEQNLSLIQENDQLYYDACRDICCGEELLVWYGKSYEMYMGIPVGIIQKMDSQSIECKMDTSQGKHGHFENVPQNEDTRAYHLPGKTGNSGWKNKWFNGQLCL
ncbi:hypothetical protein QZH41_011900 [Actinostola sp. cb2023]|nr:hypothetical protein QZH41_011900 [Actinostola sp. cb2023]